MSAAFIAKKKILMSCAAASEKIEGHKSVCVDRQNFTYIHVIVYYVALSEDYTGCRCLPSVYIGNIKY